MANVTTTFTVQDALAAPLPGVEVRVFDAAGTVFQTEGVTDAAGQVQLTLFGDVVAVNYTVFLSLTGYRFPAPFQVGVTDPPAPSNSFGPYTGTLGSSLPLVTINVNDAISAPISGAVVRFYTSPADTFITEVATDALGRAQTFLSGAADPGTSYIVRTVLSGVIFDLPVATIAVTDPLVAPQTNSFDIVGNVVTLAQAVTPNYCRVTGTLVDVSGRPLVDRIVEFKPVQYYQDPSDDVSYHLVAVPAIVNNAIHTTSARTVTNNQGQIDIELPRGGCYEVHVRGAENPLTITEFVEIPDLPAIDLLDLLFPYGQTVTTPTTVEIDSSVAPAPTQSFTVTLSDGRVISDAQTLSTLLEFTPADTTVVTSAEISNNQTLRINAGNPGSTTITITRRSGTFGERVPALSALVNGTITVTVT